MVAERGDAPRSRRTWPERLLLALGVALVVGIAGTAVGVAYGAWRLGQVETYDIDLPDVASGDPANFLIVGSDSRESVASDDPNSGAFLEGELHRVAVHLRPEHLVRGPEGSHGRILPLVQRRGEAAQPVDAEDLDPCLLYTSDAADD